jgi:hypothetical protein
LAIYCSNIEVLEQEVYPYMVSDLQINPDQILRFHKGNKAYPQPEGSELEFRSLDLPISQKRFILLVQVGKEGWDCPSLTGVILSQKGDSPQNMVLQTSCRCLRQVDAGREDTAKIWLNQENADTLNKQLKLEQNTSIEELNKVKSAGNPETVERHSRMEFLQLPKVDFYQMKVTYQAVEEEESENTLPKLQALLSSLADYKATAMITTSGLANLDTGEIDCIDETGINCANFNQWLFEIARGSFCTITENKLRKYQNELREIYLAVTYEKQGQRFFNDLYDLYAIESQIRLAFSIRRELQTDSEVIPQQAELLIAGRLCAVEKNPRLFPAAADVEKILELDQIKESVQVDSAELEKAYQSLKNHMESQGMGHFTPSYESFKAEKDYSLPVKSKNHTFHYMPYNFGGSGSSSFEREAFEKTLQLAVFREKELEIYYNGERGLTEFVIHCFAKKGKNWKNIGKYTTDFLMVKRTDKDAIHKALLIETKGAIYAEDKVFQQKKHFVETQFLQLNQEKFGYQRFDFLYLEDSKDIAANLSQLQHKINQFFTA